VLRCLFILLNCIISSYFFNNTHINYITFYKIHIRFIDEKETQIIGLYCYHYNGEILFVFTRRSSLLYFVHYSSPFLWMSTGRSDKGESTSNLCRLYQVFCLSIFSRGNRIFCHHQGGRWQHLWDLETEVPYYRRF